MDKKKNHSIVSNAIFNVVRVGSNLLITLITFPYISRVLGPEYLGKVNFATSVINYFVLFASLGIPLYGVIACSKVRDNKKELNKTVSELLILNIILMIISYGIFIYHMLVINFLKTVNVNGIWGILITLVITPIIALVSAITVERIALRYKK